MRRVRSRARERLRLVSRRETRAPKDLSLRPEMEPDSEVYEQRQRWEAARGRPRAATRRIDRYGIHSRYGNCRHPLGGKEALRSTFISDHIRSIRIPIRSIRSIRIISIILGGKCFFSGVLVRGALVSLFDACRMKYGACHRFVSCRENRVNRETVRSQLAAHPFAPSTG